MIVGQSDELCYDERRQNQHYISRVQEYIRAPLYE